MTEEPSNEPQRPRNNRGQFQSTGRTCPEDLERRRAIRKLRKGVLKSKGLHHYCAMLSAFFLTAEQGHWVPGDAGDGPIHNLAVGLFDEKHLPKQSERSEKVRDMYFEFEMNKKQQDLDWAWIFNGRTGRKHHKRIFKKRRIPRLEHPGEKRKVDLWIRNALRADVLKVETYEGAFEIVRKQLLGYRYQASLGKGCWCFDYYPFKERSSSLRNARQTSPGNNQSSATRVVVNSDASTALIATQSVRAPPNRVSICNLIEPSAIEAPGQANEENRRTAFYIDRIFCTARDSLLFILLCRVVDDNVDSMMFCAAPAILKQHQNGLIKLDTLLLDALQYVYELNFGVRNISEHRMRRQRLHRMVELLKKARFCLGLSQYDQLMYTDYGITEIELNRNRERAAGSSIRPSSTTNPPAPSRSVGVNIEAPRGDLSLFRPP